MPISESFLKASNNKKLNKIIHKNLDYIKNKLRDKYNLQIYQLDKNLFIDTDKEEYYDNLFSTIYKNYNLIIETDPKFYIEVSDEYIQICLNRDTKEEVRIWIYPYSVETKNQNTLSVFEFRTKKNLYKKYIKKYTKIEFDIESNITKKLVNSFITKNKIDRSDNINSLLND